VSVKAGSFTPNATGNLSIDGLTFLPTEIQFSLGAATGVTATTYITYSRGWTTASNQSYDTFYSDSTGMQCKGGTDKCIRLYKRSTTIVDAVAATFVDFHDNGGGDYGFTINLSAYDTNFQVRYIARD